MLRREVLRDGNSTLLTPTRRHWKAAFPDVEMQLTFHASHALFYLAATLGAGVFYVSEELLLSCR